MFIFQFICCFGACQCSFYPHITVTWEPIHHRCLVFCKLKINLSKTFIHQEGWLQKRIRPEDQSSLSFTTSDIVCRGTQPREYSGGSRGRAWAIIFRREWGSKGRKFYFRPPPYIKVWITLPPPPPRHLKVWAATAVISKNDRMWQFESIKSSRIL